MVRRWKLLLRLALSAGLGLGLGLSGPASALDPFEIQVYDAQVLDYGNEMEELHLIAKPAVTNPLPEVAARDPGFLHLTFEPQVGLGHHLVPIGHDLHVGPDFEPQAKANCSIAYDLAPGIEYYAELGPILNWLPVRAESHALFYTLDFYRWQKVEVGVGVGQPLTRASGAWTLNTNLGLQLP